MPEMSRKTLGLALLLLVVTLAAYWPALRGGYLWDDNDHIENCKQLRSAYGLYEIWFKPEATVQYYPLTFTVFWVGYHLWGLNTLGYHLVNVFLHVGTAVLLWQVLRRLRVPGAFLAGAIFALHPVHVMSVAWMTELKNVLSGALFLGAVWAYIRFAEMGVYGPAPGLSPDASAAPGLAPITPHAGARQALAPATPRSWHLYALAVGLFVLAMFAKTSTSLLVPSLLLLLWWQRDKLTWRDALPVVVALLAGSLLAEPLGWWLRGSFKSPAALSKEFEQGEVLLVKWLNNLLGRHHLGPADWWPLLKLPLLAVLTAAGGLALWAWRKRICWRDMLPVTPFILVMLAFSKITFHVEMRHGATGDPYILTLAQRLLIAGKSFWFYTAKLLAPYDLTFIYFRWPIGWPENWEGSDGRAYLFPAALAVLIVVLFVFRRRIGRGPLAAVLYSFVGSSALILAVVLFMTRFTWVSDHWQYLGSMSLIALFAAGAERATQRLERHEMLRWAAAGAVMLVLGVLTFSRARVFTDSGKVWEDTLAKNDYCSLVHNNYGGYLDGKKRPEEAFHHYVMAQACDATNDLAYRNMGSYYLKKKQYVRALVCFRKAIKINADISQLQMQIGMAMCGLGRAHDAKPYFRKALELDPTSADAWFELAQAQGADASDPAGESQAIENYLRALELEPKMADAYNNLGNIYLRRNEYQKAADCFSKAIELDPKLAEAQRNLGTLLFLSRRYPEAAQCFRLAVAADPQFTKAHFDLANVSLLLNHVEVAIAEFQTTIAQDPSHAFAHGNLANLLWVQGLEAQAVAHYRLAVQNKPDYLDAIDHLAWILATSRNDRLRSGAEAVDLAKRACALAREHPFRFLDTLAAAYAENGQFREAVETADSAVDLANAEGETQKAKEIRDRSKLYREKHPWREGPDPDPATRPSAPRE
jgi:protein O-mannosyl-transferase